MNARRVIDSADIVAVTVCQFQKDRDKRPGANISSHASMSNPMTLLVFESAEFEKLQMLGPAFVARCLVRLKLVRKEDGDERLQQPKKDYKSAKSRS